ncbi:MAG: DNA-binding response regulator [Candidatus Omnitrophica bacterium CG11_big_fil_rev_8_21_14_0_20_45_26]|uniref:DNA-binding response regulator n=1 Tax=Candidatus Abzuiibacterium crystallinum TaxID=1974748 RepID=A0A2H0LSL8_9BACT|nr:MAG: DNA-binding response regulator [Candidatus Omnitrophica bacterium CG11_big_fil_rev_8_21_14_0_20_45_26]PIW64407.1 MAG: DNA-binding response regulator [Candidatus Omnitrophica bacterium CG12_big_fil_rev_8_21_14_0_65_45_16]
MKPISVLLAEDHEVVRQGLRMLLEAAKDIKVVGEACTGREALVLAKKFKPDVIVMDIAMPNLNGLEATKKILEALPATKIIILSAHSDDIYIEKVSMLGAAGYLVKQNSAQVLVKAVREVQKGKIFYSSYISKRLDNLNPEVLNAKGKRRHQKVRLSSREAEVLQLVAEGKANKEIASELEISIKTVEKHRQHLMAKLKIHDTAGLTRYAISAGVIESSSQSTIR